MSKNVEYYKRTFKFNGNNTTIYYRKICGENIGFVHVERKSIDTHSSSCTAPLSNGDTERLCYHSEVDWMLKCFEEKEYTEYEDYVASNRRFKVGDVVRISGEFRAIGGWYGEFHEQLKKHIGRHVVVSSCAQYDFGVENKNVIVFEGVSCYHHEDGFELLLIADNKVEAKDSCHDSRDSCIDKAIGAKLPDKFHVKCKSEKESADLVRWAKSVNLEWKGSSFVYCIDWQYFWVSDGMFQQADSTSIGSEVSIEDVIPGYYSNVADDDIVKNKTTFEIGDEVMVCSIQEDVGQDGYLYPGHNGTEAIMGCAGEFGVIIGSVILESNNSTYYNISPTSTWIKESCLKLVKAGPRYVKNEPVTHISDDGHDFDCLDGSTDVDSEGFHTYIGECSEFQSADDAPLELIYVDRI